MLSVALGQPLDCKLEEFIVLPTDNSEDPSKLISDCQFFNELLLRIPICFTENGTRKIVNNLLKIWKNDIRLTIEIAESKILLKTIFELSEFIKEREFLQIHKELFQIILRSQGYGISNYIRGDVEHKLMLINDGLSYILVNGAHKFEKLQLNALRLLELSYAIEDFIVQYPNQLASKEMIQIMCRLLNLLDKLDLIYISTPSIFLFDDRLLDVEKVNKNIEMHSNFYDAKGNIFILREGGYVRIILKVLFLLIKFDESLEQPYIELLKYFIFRDKKSRNWAETKTGIPNNEEFANNTGKHGSLMDLIQKKSPERSKLQNETEGFYMKKIVQGEPSILDHKLLNTKKTEKEYPMNRCMFCQNQIMMVQIFAQIFQLLYFKILNISSFLELGSQSEIIKRLENCNVEGIIKSQQFKQLIILLEKIIKSEKGIALTRALNIEFIETIKSTIQNINPYLRGEKAMKIGSAFSILDTIIRDSSNRIRKIQQEEMKDYSHKIDSISQEQIERFIKDWETYIEGLFNITTWSMYDEVIETKIVGKVFEKPKEKNLGVKIKKYEEIIKEIFNCIGIPKEKMGKLLN